MARQAHEHPDQLALLSVDDAGRETRWTFRAVEERSSRLAHALRARGLVRGATVLITVSSLPQRILAQLAVMKAGGVILLVRPGSTARELTSHLARVAPALSVAGPESAHLFPSGHTVLTLPSPELEHEPDIPPTFESLRLRSDDPALIMLTGGTTGPPKMVLHTHGSKPYYYLRWTVTFDSDDLTWDFSGRWWMGAWRHGSPIFDRAMPTARGPEITRVVLETLARYPITRLMATPRLYRAMLDLHITKRTCPALRRCWSSGQTLDPTVFRAWKHATGIPLEDRYNQTECGEAPVRYPEGTDWKPGCIGKPVPDIEMGVVDAAGRRLPPDTLGDIAIKVKPRRPPSLFREYWRDPQATAARHRGDWYLTGDVGREDQDGLFYIAGRLDDVINCGGENIGPYELESVLLEHAAVRDVAVVGKPDPELGEVPRAYVVTESGILPSTTLADELMQFVNQAIHPFKRLRDIEFIDALPTTEAGKVSRRELRDAPHLGHR